MRTQCQMLKIYSLKKFKFKLFTFHQLARMWSRIFHIDQFLGLLQCQKI